MSVKKKCLYVFFAACLICFIRPAWAQDADFDNKPWERFSVNLGALISAVDTSLNLAFKGLGVEVDVEDFFGMDTTNSVFKLNASWRFTENRRHRLDFDYSYYHRDGFRKILDDITTYIDY